MRGEAARRFASRLLPSRPLTIRPPMVGGFVVVLAIIGVVVWLSIVGGGSEDPETVGAQLQIPLAEEEGGTTEAPPSEALASADTADHGDGHASEGHDGAGDGAAAPQEPEPDAPVAHDEAAPDVSEGAHPTEPDTHEQGDPTDPPAETAAPMPDAALAPVDPVLLQPSSLGSLPIVGPDGRRPWQVYARPFEAAEGAPRLAIVVSELGFNRDTTEAALKLPPEVTLSFSPYAPDVAGLVARARQAGHEVLLDLPMEPTSYPADDPGPQALLTSLDATDNIERLENVLGRAQGYVGVISQMGSKFTTSPDALRPVLSVLSERGLLFVDGKTNATSIAGTLAEQLKLPHASNDRFIDNEATRMAIEEGLSAVESDARRGGVAVGVGRPFPVTLQRLAAWLPSLASRGIALAPVSAVVNRQSGPK